ncbi:MAG: hypothetical protein Q9M94_01965 [Candidatus Gracilibacteria bacterium]|nr:hypothetical protein [Candidatus Gracilibacteria bacterium]
MIIMTLTIDDKSQDLIEALKTIISNFKGVSFKIETPEAEAEEDVLNNFRNAMKDIKNENGVKYAISSQTFLTEIKNG